VKSFTPVPTYKCDICGKQFQFISSMNHYAESIHEKNEPFQCDICDTSFLQECSLKQHKESIHEKIKPVEGT
jgi:DNA-directed RNA polymerase subunit RPC12/RpoP